MRRLQGFMALVWVPIALGWGACSNNIGTQSVGLTSLRVTNFQPAQLGSPGHPVTISDASFDVTAYGADGKVIEQDLDADVYLSFSGNKVGLVTACGIGEDINPLASIHLTKGVATNQKVHLISAFGAVTVWIEERTTKAIGSSDIIYFPQPTIPDVQTPLDQTVTTATYCSPWNNRHVIIDTATNGGQLVVTSVFKNAYVVVDTGAMFVPAHTDDRTGMMVPDQGGFNAMYVYAFGRPDIHLQPGVVIKSFSGNLSKFVGFTELNFPLQEWLTDGNLVEPKVIASTVPPPYVLTPSDRPPKQSDIPSNVRLLKMAGNTVQVVGSVCPIDTSAANPQWQKFNQFVVSLDGDASMNPCDNFTGFAVELPSKVLPNFDPVKVMGTPVKFQITGMLKNSSGQNDACKGVGPIVTCRTSSDCGNAALDPMLPPACQANLNKASVSCVEGTCRRGVFNFWTVVPRSSDDIKMFGNN